MVVDANHPAGPAPLGPAGLPERPPSGRRTYGAGNYSGLDRLRDFRRGAWKTGTDTGKTGTDTEIGFNLVSVPDFS